MASICAFIDWKGLFILQYIMKLSILKEILLLCVYVLLHKCVSAAYVGVAQACKCCTSVQALHMWVLHKCASVALCRTSTQVLPKCARVVYVGVAQLLHKCASVVYVGVVQACKCPQRHWIPQAFVGCLR